MSHDSLGDRMKAYEDVSRIKLTKRVPKVIRIDGKAFHTFLKNADKPYDRKVLVSMSCAAGAVMESIGGTARLAYIQSDECSILLNDALTLNTEAWFDNNVQKIVSVAASTFTAYFNSMYDWFSPPDGDRPELAMFDARVFQLPDETEVNNYFIWRQKDAVRNSIQQFGRAHFSHNQLQGISNETIKEWLAAAGHPFEAEASWKRQGIIIHNDKIIEETPLFWEDKNYISDLFNPPEEEGSETSINDKTTDGAPGENSGGA